MKVSFTPTLSVLNQMQRTSKAISKSLERLSSGKRVNRAADDSVTLSRDAGMEAQVRGLRQGIQNANQAIGMLSTAESAISTQLEIVTKMRELALRASNGTLTSTDRTNINTEINQLFQEFQRITNTTEFNGQYLLNGSMGKVGLQIGDKRESGMDQIFMDISNLDASQVFQKTVGDGTFNTRTTYVSGKIFQSLATGDVNSDGRVDIVGVEDATGTTYVLLGNGDGTYQSAKTTLGGELGSLLVKLSDINSDGKLDLAVTNYNDSYLRIRLGNGDGTFGESSTYSVGEWGDALANNFEFADITGDGVQDLVSISTDTTGVSYRVGNGDGSFGAAQTWYSDVSASVYTFKLADFNNDGKVDLGLYDVSAGGEQIFLNNGNGTVSAATTTINIGFSNGSFADFNNDGKLDYVGFNKAYLGNGDGTFQTGVTIGGSSGNWIVGDINGDSKIDLISYSTGVVRIGNGDGTFTRSTTISVPSAATAFGLLTDVNDDGVLDYINNDVISGGIGVATGDSMQASAISNIDASTQAKAQALLGILDTTMSNLKSEQSRLGGLHERLDQAVSTNLLRADSIDEARENANSADLALETANLVRFQILQQAQVAVLAQANFSAQLVTQLLKF